MGGSPAGAIALKRFWTKATVRESGAPRRSANWMAARRAWFNVFEDRVECGDWNVPFATVEQATLYTGRQFFVRVTVLELRVKGKTYQFGFNPWVNVERHLALDLDRQEVRFGYSAFSIALRVLLAGYVAFLLVRWLV